MLGPALLAPALASAVLAWGVPAAATTTSSPSSTQSIFGPDTALDPDVAPALGPNVRGSRDKEIIRRIIRRHINEVKVCYEQELERHPDIAGRILVQFTIAASGQVISSVLKSSTMHNAHVENCTVQAVRRWEFPKPLGGGVVIVEYPFVLTPAAPRTVVPGKNGAGAVDIMTLDPTMYIHRSTDATGISANGLVAVVGGGLLLVDTGWTAEQTEAILAWGDGFFRRPWIGALITHDHNDRDGGLAALERRHIPVAALDLTVAKLAKRGVRGVATLFAARDGFIKDPRGFEAYYPGRGHASDNIVIHFPGLVFGGCLVKSMDATDLGFTGDADLAAWPVAIRNVRARYNDHPTIVPGHGPLDAWGESYEHTLDLLMKANVPAAAPQTPGH